MTAPVQVFKVRIQETHVHKSAIAGESFSSPHIHRLAIMTGHRPDAETVCQVRLLPAYYRRRSSITLAAFPTDPADAD